MSEIKRREQRLNQLSVSDIVMNALVNYSGKGIDHWVVANVKYNAQEDRIYGILYDDGDGPSAHFHVDLKSVKGAIT